MNASDYAKLI